MHKVNNRETVGARARRMAAVVCVSTAAIMAFLILPGTAGAGNRPRPRPASSLLRMSRAKPFATAPASKQLEGVTCPSSSDCWAVGSKSAPSVGTMVNEALRFNGKKWASVSTPDPGGRSMGDRNALLGVTCTSASNCWAVGYDTPSGGPQAAEVLRWNGKKWSSVSTGSADALRVHPGPDVSISKDMLGGVACSSASDCWAVGTEPNANGAIVNQILRFNGSVWSPVSAPDPGGKKSGDQNELNSVSCDSASDCWAVGDAGNGSTVENEVLHFNGRKWSLVTVAQPGGTSAFDELTGVSCVSGPRCIAVGTTQLGSGPVWNEALRFNGKQWTALSPLQPGSLDILHSVSCTSAANCWAVGNEQTLNRSGGTTTLNQALWWNGHTWAAFSTPQPGGTGTADSNQLNGVACVSTSDCRAVGQVEQANASPDEMLHWTGERWLSG